MGIMAILWILLWFGIVGVWTWSLWKIASSLGKMVSLMEDYLQRIDYTLACLPAAFQDGREQGDGS